MFFKNGWGDGAHKEFLYDFSSAEKAQGEKSYRKICFSKMGGVMGHTGNFYMIFPRPKKHRGKNLIGKFVFKKWVGVKPSAIQGLGGLSAIQGLSIRVQGLGFSDFGFKYRFLGFSDFGFRVQGLGFSIQELLQGFQGLYRSNLQGFQGLQVSLIGFRVQIGFYSQGLGFISLSIQGLGLQGIRFLGGVPTGHHLASEVFEERSKRKSHGATFISRLPHLLT